MVDDAVYLLPPIVYEIIIASFLFVTDCKDHFHTQISNL